MELYELFREISNKNIIKYVIIFLIIIIIGSYYDHNISYYFITFIIYLFIIYNIQMKWYLTHENDNNSYNNDHLHKQLNISEDNMLYNEIEIKIFLHEMIFISYYSLELYNKIIDMIEKYLKIYNYLKRDVDILDKTILIKANKLTINQKRLLVKDLNNLKNMIIEEYCGLILILPNNKRIIDKYNESIQKLINLLNKYYEDIINRKDIDNLIEINYINSFNYNNKNENMI